jgi:hypothetical protein
LEGGGESNLVATPPFAEQSTSTSDRAERAALLSSEYHGLRKRRPIAAHVPAGFAGTMPVAPNQIRTLLDRALRQKGADAPASVRSAQVANAAAYGFKGSGQHAGIAAELRERSVELLGERSRKLPLRHDAYTDIDFNEELVTKITVHSWIQGVTEAEAIACVDKSHPPNWSKAIDTFYKQSLPVSWNARAGGYVADETVKERGRYDLLEYVTWDWSLQNDGGIANILRIEERTPSSGELAELVGAIVDKAGEESAHEALLVPRPQSEEGFETAHAITYTYRLVRCIQAKFASIWESGGLDVDQGSFTVAWLKDTQTLYVSGNKALRYSHEADIVPGFANMLNMLAPAVTSMLMKQLAYHAFVTYLENSRDPERTP